MTTRFATTSLFATVLAAGAIAVPATAQTTTAAFSAANCIPRNAGAFDGSGADGFQWEDSGVMLNREPNDPESLICAVPYDPSLRRADGTVPYLDVALDVIDGATNASVTATMFGQNGNVTATVLRSVSTTALEAGRRTLRMSLIPSTSLRYVWVRVNVPFTVNSVSSGVVGYQVRRY